MKEEIINTLNNLKIVGRKYITDKEAIRNNSESYPKIRMASEDLHAWYNFNTEEVSPEVIIHESDIKFVLDRRFEYVDSETVKKIFEIAENCDIAKNIDFSNFYICNDGRILLGGDMKEIKERLDGIKEAYNRFVNDKLYRYDVIEVENIR